MKKLIKKTIHLISRSQYTLVKTLVLIGRERRTDVLSDEYIRVSSLELLVDEITRRGVQGVAAELGVYQGGFDKHINCLFPERELFLFDTFSGFEKTQLAKDINDGLAAREDDFSNTSIEMVLSQMKHPQRVRICRGVFPESTNTLGDLTFCLVSIDCDLHDPILAGLRYFWPRLSPGGYIMVHDYNNALYKGAKNAVDTFCSETGTFPIPLTDSAGSAILSKAASLSAPEQPRSVLRRKEQLAIMISDGS